MLLLLMDATNKKIVQAEKHNDDSAHTREQCDTCGRVGGFAPDVQKQRCSEVYIRVHTYIRAEREDSMRVLENVTR